MNNRSRYVPALIMLTAGFVTCISTIIHDYTTEEILLITAGVMSIFLIVGFIVRFIIDKYIIIQETDEENKEDSEENSENEENDDKSEKSEKKESSDKE